MMISSEGTEESRLGLDVLWMDETFSESVLWMQTSITQIFFKQINDPKLQFLEEN